MLSMGAASNDVDEIVPPCSFQGSQTNMGKGQPAIKYLNLSCEMPVNLRPIKRYFMKTNQNLHRVDHFPINIQTE